MALNPVIHLDKKGAAAFIGWSGEVNTFAELPDASINSGQFYMVLNESGSRLTFNYRASGLYRAEGGQWVKKNNVQLLLNDDQFTIYNSIDSSKVIKFDASLITTTTTRTFSFPDENGTVALFSQIPISANTVYVRTDTDFGTPSGGEIQLTDDTNYVILDAFTTANELVIPFGGSVLIRSLSRTTSTWTYTGSGAAISGGLFDRIEMKDVQIILTDSVAEWYSLIASNSALDTVIFEDCRFTSTAVGGSFGSFIQDVGLTISNSGYTNVSFRHTLFNCTGEVASCSFSNSADFSAEFISIRGNNPESTTIRNNAIYPRANESAIRVDPGTWDSSSRLSVEGNTTYVPYFTAGELFDPTGVDESDNRVTAFNNFGRKDSYTTAETYLNVTETVTITAVNTPVPIAGGNWAQGPTENFTIDANGLITANLFAPTICDIKVIATIDKVGGGSDFISVAILVNGTIVAEPYFGTDSSTPSISMATSTFQLNDTDTIQAAVLNEDTTSNINVVSCSIQVDRKR